VKIALTVQYDGSLFFGFQVQNDQRTIQGEIEEALKIYFRREIRIHGAGRTDTGVHSMGQIIHFELPDQDLDFDRTIYSLNCILPDDITFVYGAKVPLDFHARFSCIGREYVYRVLNSPFQMALFRKDHLWVRKPLSLKLMEQAAEFLVGEHDFAAFTRKIYLRNSEKTIRRIDKISIVTSGEFLYFHYQGSGFLHNMIRIVTGTLIMVGKGEIHPEKLKEILISKDRSLAGITLPPKALVFLNALYDDFQTPRESIPFYRFLVNDEKNIQ
jgi:tRNA pseudouridine38-40 synthase